MSLTRVASPPRLSARLVDMPPGDHRLEPRPVHLLIEHVGPPVMARSRAGRLRAGPHLQRAGDLDFIPAGTPAHWRDAGPSRLLVVSLCPSVMEDAARRLGRNGRRRPLNPWLRRRDARLSGLARLAEGVGADGADAVFAEALAGALAVRLLALAPETEAAAASRSARPLDPNRLARVLSHIDAHLDDTLSLDSLARQAGLKRSQFAAAFRRATGLSPHQFVLRRRAEAARDLLMTGTIPISEVAYQTGFSHQSHLSRAMRRLTGLSPGELVALGREGAPPSVLAAPAFTTDPSVAGG